ncbi:MAG: DUF6438 domain-containing protein [Bacteroidota bacterium]
MDNKNKIASLKKEPCFSNCQNYKFTIFEDGTAIFNGIQNTRRQGRFYKKFDEETLDAFINFCASADLWQYESVYRSNYPDMQTIVLSYFEGNNVKTITGKRERPMAIIEVEEELDKLAFSNGWTALDKDANNDNSGEGVSNTSQLIVKLNQGLDALAWSLQYNDEGLKIVKAISDDKTYWLVEFNAAIISTQQMIQTLRKDPNVFSVQEQ